MKISIDRDKQRIFTNQEVVERNNALNEEMYRLIDKYNGKEIGYKFLEQEIYNIYRRKAFIALQEFHIKGLFEHD